VNVTDRATPGSSDLAPEEPLPDESHFRRLAGHMLDGNVVPFLGAGVNMWGRVSGQPPAEPSLPNGTELARQLAPADWPADRLDLLRVSQYVDLTDGSGPLYQRLRRVFNRDYPSTPLHDLLAALPGMIAARDYKVAAPLLVTTNYDYVLERAFQAAQQEFEQVTYVANGEHAGRFAHRKWRVTREGGPPEPGAPTIIRVPSEYKDEDLSKWKRPVLLKIHGAVDTSTEEGDSYVITEDHYIDYLAQADMDAFLPVEIGKRLRSSHVLFLAYGLRDWNMRVLLRRLWSTRRLTWNSWAIQRYVEDLDRLFWRRHNVEVLDVRLESYITELSRQIVAVATARGTQS
jgi:hypothetical protein